MGNVYTIGHSTLPIEDFRGLLRDNGIGVLIDIRTIPRSRANPQFNQGALRVALESAGIMYVHLPCLGGLRRPRRDSPNDAWRNQSFRGFADYMLTKEFEDCLGTLIEIISARSDGVALMCAEAVPWRCHRSLVADALYVRGFHATHLVGASGKRPHTLTAFAVVCGTSIRYPRAK